MLSQNSAEKIRSEISYAEESGLLSIKNEKLFIALSVKGQFVPRSGFDDSRYYGMNILALKYKAHDVVPSPPLLSPQSGKSRSPYLCGFLPLLYMRKKIYTVSVYDHVKTYFDDDVICISADGGPIRFITNKYLRFISYRLGCQPYFLKKLKGGKFHRTILVFPREPIILLVDIYDGRDLEGAILNRIKSNFFFRSFEKEVKLRKNKLYVTHDKIDTCFENIYPPDEISNITAVKTITSKGSAYILDDNNRIHQESGYIKNIKAIYFGNIESEAPKFNIEFTSLLLKMKVKTKSDTYNIQLDMKNKIFKRNGNY